MGLSLSGYSARFSFAFTPLCEAMKKGWIVELAVTWGVYGVFVALGLGILNAIFNAPWLLYVAGFIVVVPVAAFVGYLLVVIALALAEVDWVLMAFVAFFATPILIGLFGEYEGASVTALAFLLAAAGKIVRRWWPSVASIIR
jgi:hypothetical protein